MAAEETEFSAEATPVFDDGGASAVSPQSRQAGGQRSGAASPQPNLIQPNVTGQATPGKPQSFSLGDDQAGSGIGPGTSLPLGFDDGLFADDDAGFLPGDDFDGFGSSASNRPALLIDTQSGTQHEIRALPFMIGRDGRCDLVLDDLQIAPQHAEIIDEFGRMVIRELSAEAGQDQPIEVNGYAVDQVMLEQGDSVRIGRYLFEFQPGKGVTNKPADLLLGLNPSSATESKPKNVSFMARMRRQWMFLLPLAALGYAGYVLLDMYVLAPTPTLMPPKVAKRTVNPQQVPLDGAMQTENGGIHFTLGDAPSEIPGAGVPQAQVVAPTQRQPDSRQSAPQPSGNPNVARPSTAFNYEKIFTGGGDAAQPAQQSAERQAQSVPQPQVANAPRPARPQGNQWPRFADDDVPANTGRPDTGRPDTGRPNTGRPEAVKPIASRPSHLENAGAAFPSFPEESVADAPWPDDQKALEGELLEGELLEGELLEGELLEGEILDKQPSFAEQIGTRTGGRNEAAPEFSTGFASDRSRRQQPGATADASSNSDRVRVNVDVPIKPQQRPPTDWMSQQDPYATDTPARTDRPQRVSSAAADGPEDVFETASEEPIYDNKADEDPFMQMIEKRLATLEQEQRAKVEAVRESKPAGEQAEALASAAEGDYNDAMADNAMPPSEMFDETMADDTSELAMVNPRRADDTQPLYADEMPIPPSESLTDASLDVRPGPGMPLPADRLDKSQDASAFDQPQHLSADAAEAAARDLVLQAELIYKEEGAKKLLDDLKRLSAHPDVSNRLKTQLANQYAQISKLYQLYTAGQTDFALGSKEEAFEHWIAFLSAEKVVIPTGTTRYAAEVRNIVAQEYVARATDAEQSQDWSQAWRYWNAAKKFGKTAMANRKMRDIEERAQRLFDQGIDLEATDPVSARNMWQRVMTMLPEQHALHGQASAKVQWYEQWRY